MPIAAKRPCLAPRCPNLVSSGYCPDHADLARRYDRDRSDDPVRRLYWTPRWRAYSRWFLRGHRRRTRPICPWCASTCARIARANTPSGQPEDPMRRDPGRKNNIARRLRCSSGALQPNRVWRQSCPCTQRGTSSATRAREDSTSGFKLPAPTRTYSPFSIDPRFTLSLKYELLLAHVNDRSPS